MRKPDKKAKRVGIRRGTEDSPAKDEPPNYEIWLNKPCWYVNEICCLVKGFDPNCVSGGVVVDLNSGEVEPAPKNYRAIVIVADVSEMIRRAIVSGELMPAVSGGNCFKPITVITYLNQKGIVLPRELLAALQPQGVATKDAAWKNTAKEIADSIYRKADGFDPSKKSIAKSIEKEFSKRGIRSVKDKKLSFDNILRHGLKGWNRPRK
jgi:hypothetical protein